VRRSQLGIAITIISIASVVAPGMAGPASIDSSSGGGNPNSLVCKAIKANASQTFRTTTLDAQFKKAAEAAT